MRGILLAVALSLTAGCVKAPPNLTPAAVVAFHGTQAVKALDLLRDAAIAAHAQGLMPEASTRLVVQYHESVLKTIQAAPDGWKPTAQVALDELLTRLSAGDRKALGPYITLAKTIVQEVGR